MKKKVNRNKSNKIFCEQSSFIKRVTRTFRVVVAQNNGKEMYKKVFLLIRPIFSVLVAASLALHDLIFWLNYRNSNGSFAFILYSVDRF